MARKIRGLLDEKLQSVIALREGGSSWVKIQKEVGIDRRTAKRAYEQWERSQAREELKAARQNIAAEEFRNHLYSLIKLAQSLIKALTVPKLPGERRRASDILLKLWQSDIVGQYGAYGLPSLRAETNYIVGQNQILFKSLQTHTQEKVDWHAVEKWEDSWNRCIDALVKLEAEGKKILKNILEQKSDLKVSILRGTQRKDIAERILKGILHVVWRHILDGRLSKTFPLLRIAPRSDGRTEVLFGEDNFDQGIIFNEARSAKEVSEVCKWAAQNLSKEDLVEKLADEVDTMHRKIEELRESLGPLILKPLILRTRCDLCPA